MGEKKMEGSALEAAAAEGIAVRLSSLDNLYFPRAVQSTAASSDQRKSILLDLLRRDPAVFLERYGSELNVNELLAFDNLKDDYEVDWHLKSLRKKISPTSEELKSRSVAVRNRRLAYLNKLVSEGQYFSEDSMRDREPYLHHEYVGKFQDLMGRNMARPGERWSETLMRRAEEATLVARIREEQQRLGVAETDWIGNETTRMEEEEETEEEEEETEEEEEEEEEDSSSDEEDKIEEVKKPKEPSSSHEECTSGSSRITDSNKNGSSNDREENETARILPPEDMQDMMDQFTSIMQQKFLSGEDHEHLDYSKIDSDETLDDHWLREINLDAEEKYFGED